MREAFRGPGRFLGALILLTASSQANAGNFWKPFVAGVVSGLVIHESAHLALDIAYDAEPRFKRVSFGPLPFFALTHRGNLAPRREALISGAGFVSQHLTSEWILARRQSEEPLSNFEKGALAFHVGTSLAYSGAALTRHGPFERDTRGLADATHTDERVIGLLVLAPAALDTWRYLRPQSRVARWGSRVAKAGFLGFLVFKR